MKCAPIIIPTLNRVEHLARLLDSLKVNPLSSCTDVYVGFDFPPSPSYEEGYKRMSEYLEGDFSCFRSFNVIKRRENLGYLKNVDDLINKVLKHYDRFIYMDDDLEVSSNFLEYMNYCLDVYEYHDDVIAVCGYSYPIKWNVSPQATIFKEAFICPMWGTGFWRYKYNTIQQYIKHNGGLARDARKIVRSGGFKRMTNVCRSEFVDLCFSPDFNITLASKVTDISLRMYMATYNMNAIMPVLSKVRNWGFDGTGEYCTNIYTDEEKYHSKMYSYDRQPINQEKDFVVVLDTLKDITTNKTLMNNFDQISLSRRLIVCLKLVLFVLVGMKNYHRLTMAIRKMKHL